MDVGAQAFPSIPAAFADLLGYHLRIAQEASFAAIQQAAGGLAFKPGWYTILTLLAESPGATPSELSLKCGRDRSTLTGTLKELAKQGLISRRRKTNDQRSYVIRLTAEGREMLARVSEFATRHEARLDAIAGADRAMLIAALRRIAFGLAAAAVEPPVAATLATEARGEKMTASKPAARRKAAGQAALAASATMAPAKAASVDRE